MKKILFKSISAFTLSAVLLSSSGCATLFGKSNYNVTLNSEPSAADVTITDKKGIEIYKGTTPATVKLKSSSGYFSRGQYQVKLHMANYEDRTFTIDSKLNGWYFGNLFLGGLIGMLIIDPASGSMYKIKDKTHTETLKAQTTAQAKGLEIIDINSLPSSTVQDLEKIN